MSETNGNSKPLRVIGLTRKSKGEDQGTHDDQRRIIEDRCAREGFTLVRVDSDGLPLARRDGAAVVVARRILLDQRERGSDARRPIHVVVAAGREGVEQRRARIRCSASCDRALVLVRELGIALPLADRVG